VLGEHKYLRAGREYWVSAFVSPARALPLRAPMGLSVGTEGVVD